MLKYQLAAFTRVTRREDEDILNLSVQLLLWIDAVDLFSYDFVAIDATDLAIIHALVQLAQ